MTSSKEISKRQANAQRDALAALGRYLNVSTMRVLIVERVRLAMDFKYGTWIYLPPYMEVRLGSRLLATIYVSERTGRAPQFIVKPPGRLGIGTGVKDVGDADTTAQHIHGMWKLADLPIEDNSESG